MQTAIITVEKKSTNCLETKHKNTKNNCKQVPPVVLTSKM